MYYREKKITNMLSRLLHEVERNICYHEETHRGGAIWTICDQCGKKWADDRGGFQPYEEPDWLIEARDMVKNLVDDEQEAEQRVLYEELKKKFGE